MAKYSYEFKLMIVKEYLEGPLGYRLLARKYEISDMGDKVSRLQKASSNLETSISEVETIKGSIADLAIDPGRWKGEEESDFEEAYSSYKESVKSYISSIEGAKDVIDDEIKNYQADKAAYTIV